MTLKILNPVTIPLIFFSCFRASAHMPDMMSKKILLQKKFKVFLETTIRLIPVFED